MVFFLLLAAAEGQFNRVDNDSEYYVERQEMIQMPIGGN